MFKRCDLILITTHQDRIKIARGPSIQVHLLHFCIATHTVGTSFWLFGCGLRKHSPIFWTKLVGGFSMPVIPEWKQPDSLLPVD